MKLPKHLKRSKMTLKDLVSFIENDHNQEKGEIVLVVGGAAEKPI